MKKYKVECIQPENSEFKKFIVSGLSKDEVEKLKKDKVLVLK